MDSANITKRRRDADRSHGEAPPGGRETTCSRGFKMKSVACILVGVALCSGVRAQPQVCSVPDACDDGTRENCVSGLPGYRWSGVDANTNDLNAVSCVHGWSRTDENVPPTGTCDADAPAFTFAGCSPPDATPSVSMVLLQKALVTAEILSGSVLT